MKLPITFSRKLEVLEKAVPKSLRLPLRYHGQRFVGALEPEMYYLDVLVDPHRVAIDVGANKGIYSYALTKRAQHVYGFEPISELCDYIRRYGSPRLTAINSALADENGEFTLRIPVSNGRRVTTRASLVGNTHGEERRVRVRTLDSYDFKDVGFVKIDVEGAEERVIAGGQSTIQRDKPVLLVEVFYENGQSERCREIVTFLRTLGYESIIVTGTGPCLCGNDIFSHENGSRNILFVPKSHRFLDFIQDS
ncbi:FkbM family methyltransferase [Thioalkalivibrio thiocyanodenitrificans]|uniref:FkbM family methyltransferase n=1 Tax=Thioalkalivibrio thiocyanodenitrificans TaxID=243063 RepID=UPI000A053659